MRSERRISAASSEPQPSSLLVGTLAYTFGEGWSLVDGFYVAVATLTTSSILNPELTLTEPWLDVFTAFYVLVGIGILVEVARRLGMGFIASREDASEGADPTADGPTPSGSGGGA
jgi:hypothetical protein